MHHFPKRYTQEDIQRLEQQYLGQQSSPGDLISLFPLPSMQSLHLGHLYGLYVKDYFLKNRELQQQEKVQPAIVFQWKNLLSVSDAQQFFTKKRQNFQKIGKEKLTKYLFSRKEKGIKATTKRLSLAFGTFPIYREDDPAFALFVQNFITDARNAGKITIKKTIAYRSVELQTTIPFDQILFEQTKGKNYTIKYFIETKNDVLPVCARIPDLIFGDVALLVHPGDKRYKKLIGKKAIVPIVNRAIPVIGDTSVDISKDNGIKRVCPCCNEESIALAEKYKLPLDQYVFTPDGRYTSYAGEYVGQSRVQFYANILQYLEDISNLGEVFDEVATLPYYVSTHEQLRPFLVDEVILELEAAKALVQQEVTQNELWQSVKDQLLPLIPKVSGVLNRETPRGIPLPVLGKEENSFENEVIDSDVVSILYPLFLIQQGVPLDSTLFLEECQLSFLAKMLVIQQCALDTPFFTALQLFPSLLDKKGERFSYQSLQTNQLFMFLEKYGQSPVRLALLIHKSLDTELVVLYDVFLRQLRNGARYCFGAVTTLPTVEAAWKQFEKKADAIDVWIMKEFYLLWEKAYAADTSFSFIQQFIQKKFLGWYIEVKKEYGGGTREATAFLIFTGMLHLLYPFIPEYVRAMVQVTGLSLSSFVLPPFTKEVSPKILWLYGLFEAILWFRIQLNIKKHQKIALFVKADPNSLVLFEKHQALIKKLLNIQELSLIRLHEAEPQGYQQELYQGMIIGINLITSTTDTLKSKKLCLEELEAQYAQQGEYLQYLRTMIASMSSLETVDTAVVQAKKKEVENVKERIDTLLIQIQKMKIKG